MDLERQLDDEFEDLDGRFGHAYEQLAAGRDAEAAGEFADAAVVAQVLIARVEEFGGDHLLREKLRDGLTFAKRIRLIALAMASLAQGQASAAPSDARAAYLEAERLFSELAADDDEGDRFRLTAEVARGWSELAVGRERLLRLDYDSAASADVRARVIFEDARALITPELEAGDPLVASMGSMVTAAIEAAASAYERASFLGRFAAGDFVAACD
jgi:hypothetical protein